MRATSSDVKCHVPASAGHTMLPGHIARDAPGYRHQTRNHSASCIPGMRMRRLSISNADDTSRHHAPRHELTLKAQLYDGAARPLARRRLYSCRRWVRAQMPTPPPPFLYRDIPFGASAPFHADASGRPHLAGLSTSCRRGLDADGSTAGRHGVQFICDVRTMKKY